MDTQKIIKILKICGPGLIVCGFVGFYYVMYGGRDVEPKDTLLTIFFLAMGFYFTWLSRNPDKIYKMTKKSKGK